MGEAPLIVVIDDEEAVRQALGRLLRSMGMQVRVFASGANFLAALPALRPAC